MQWEPQFKNLLFGILGVQGEASDNELATAIARDGIRSWNDLVESDHPRLLSLAKNHTQTAKMRNLCSYIDSVSKMEMYEIENFSVNGFRKHVQDRKKRLSDHSPLETDTAKKNKSSSDTAEKKKSSSVQDEEKKKPPKKKNVPPKYRNVKFPFECKNTEVCPSHQIADLLRTEDFQKFKDPYIHSPLKEGTPANLPHFWLYIESLFYGKHNSSKIEDLETLAEAYRNEGEGFDFHGAMNYFQEKGKHRWVLGRVEFTRMILGIIASKDWAQKKVDQEVQKKVDREVPGPIVDNPFVCVIGITFPKENQKFMFLFHPPSGAIFPTAGGNVRLSGSKFRENLNAVRKIVGKGEVIPEGKDPATRNLVRSMNGFFSNMFLPQVKHTFEHTVDLSYMVLMHPREYESPHNAAGARDESPDEAGEDQSADHRNGQSLGQHEGACPTDSPSQVNSEAVVEGEAD